jgi:hypothetical protein
MKKTVILLASLSLLALGGCKHFSGSGQLHTKSVSIGVNSGAKSSGKAGRHCPPGQAKKGRC